LNKLLILVFLIYVYTNDNSYNKKLEVHDVEFYSGRLHGSKCFAIQSRYPSILVYTPGSPSPHFEVPKLTRPTWYQGSSGCSRYAIGPPESPLQLSFPTKFQTISWYTLSETQYDWRKIEPVTMKANFIYFWWVESEFMVKNQFHNWTSELGCIWQFFLNWALFGFFQALQFWQHQMLLLSFFLSFSRAVSTKVLAKG
jgi:hypothetical protein